MMTRLGGTSGSCASGSQTAPHASHRKAQKLDESTSSTRPSFRHCGQGESMGALSDGDAELVVSGDIGISARCATEHRFWGTC